MKFRKKLATIIKSKRGLILCEGETEVMYFKGLITHENNKRKLSGVGVDIYKPKDHSPKGLVDEAKKRIKQAKREKNPFDFVWVVFDKDGHVNVPNAFNEISSANVSPEIKYAFSIVCFEYFILLHFEKTTKLFSKCDDIISQIEGHLADYKKATNVYDKLLGFKDSAVSNCNFVCDQVKIELERGAKVYELHYYCNVHELVEYLESL